MITLFQSYTGGRPAEFIHSSKGKASQDPSAKQKILRNVNAGKSRREITTMRAMLVIALSSALRKTLIRI
jgi:hypothetical protein